MKIFITGRVLNHEIIIDLPNGLKFNCHGGLDLVTSHFYHLGYYIEANNKSVVKNIIDAGANIGVETARFHIHHPNAEIIAIEAEKRNFNYLNKNFQSLNKIHSIHGGLWPVQANLKVISTSVDMQAFQVVETTETKDVIKAYTIPQLMQSYQWDHIDILKLDIEGAEYQLFSRNFETWVDKVNVFIFEIPDADFSGATQIIFKALENLNFKTHHCGENLVLIKEGLPWILRKVIGFKSKQFK